VNLQRETLFNRHRKVTNKSISYAKRNLLETEQIDEFCTAIGLTWFESAELNFLRERKSSSSSSSCIRSKACFIYLVEEDVQSFRKFNSANSNKANPTAVNVDLLSF